MANRLPKQLVTAEKALEFSAAITATSKLRRTSEGGSQTDYLKVQLPSERADFFFTRAKKLYAAGGEHAVILERVVTTTLKAMSFATDNYEHYLFLAKVFMHALDLTSALFCYRYALRMVPREVAVKTRKKVAEVLFIVGQELLCEALLGKSINIDSQIGKSRAFFDECLRYDFGNKKFWVFKSFCHVQLNEIHDAQEAITQAARIDRGNSAEILILRSKLYWSLGMYQQGNECSITLMSDILFSNIEFSKQLFSCTLFTHFTFIFNREC